MKLKLVSLPSANGCTLGDLYINDKWECFTLEDDVREIIGRPVGEWKVYGKTAIPAGTYDIIITYSNRFKKELPLLLRVDGFEGVRIHAGNTAENTEGCLLVGQKRNPTSISNSRAAMDILQPKIKAALLNKERVFIEIIRAKK